MHEASTSPMDKSSTTARSLSDTNHYPRSTIHFFLLLNALTLLLTALWLRVHLLGNIPGVNGDEAWYGVQAWRMLHGGPTEWHTPTGNPLSPLLVGPLALLHLWLPPSFGLLRAVAVAGGVAALVFNWLFCRWVFDRRTAAISTVALAVLPINIAYSRFAWDASQSLAATLPAFYLALAAVRFPQRFGRWIAWSVLALAIAFWVHPTNVFAGAVVVAACAAHRLGKNRRTSDEIKTAREQARPRRSPAISISTFVILAVAGALLAIWFGVAELTSGPLQGRIAQRLGSLGELLQPTDSPPTAVLYARLFAGGTVYRYIAGSRSWFEWPLPVDSEGWGLDAVFFWIALLGSAWLLWRQSRLLHFHKDDNNRLPFQKDDDDRLRLRSQTDVALLAAWALQLAAFLVVAGPRAMSPNWERFAIGLIGPAVLLLSRGAALVYEAAWPRWRPLLAAATLLGWPLLADFHAQYFRFIEQTGGQAHLAFRTAAIEPKQAALESILTEATRTGERGERKVESGKRKGELWIVASEWWNRWPIAYLAAADVGVRVVDSKEAAVSADFRRALAQGRGWFVEFCGSPAEREVESQLAGEPFIWQQFPDYAGRPLLRVFVKTGPADTRKVSRAQSDW